MSRYTSQNARLRATLSERVRSYIASECQDTLNAIIGGLTSESLRESAVRLASVRPTGIAETERLVLSELAALPSLSSLTPELATSVETLKFDLGRASSLHTPERLRLIEAAIPRLTDLVSHVGAEVGRVERLAVTEGLSAGLGDLGYTLVRDVGGSTSAIEASRGHEKVLVVVKDGGGVTTDWVGISDGKCVDRDAELKSAAAKHGVDLSDTKASMHHDPRGGQAVASAARHHAESLAHGAILEAEGAASTSPKRGIYSKTRAGRRDRARG